MVRNLVVLGLSSHSTLTKTICSHLGLGPADMILGKFSCGETRVQIGESVRGKDVYIIQSSGGPVNDYLMELCITISACRMASANKIIVVAPLFPYSRGMDLPFVTHTKGSTPIKALQPPPQPNGVHPASNGNTDTSPSNLASRFRKPTQSSAHTGQPTAPSKISILPTLASFTPSSGYHAWTAQPGTLISNLLVSAGASHIVTMDLHDPQYQGYFDIPVDNLYARNLLQAYIMQHLPDWRSAIIVSPDAGGAKRAVGIAERLMMDFALIHKERGLMGKKGTGDEEGMMLVGDVTGRTAVMIDDLADTATTLTRAAKLLKRSGARSVWAVVTHGIFSGQALNRVNETMELDELVVTNTVCQERNLAECGKLRVVDVGHLIGEAIRRIHYGESLSQLFSG